MDAMPAFDQLQLRFLDHIQWRYEVIRPLVLFEDRTATQRAAETRTHPETVRKLTRRFRHQGTLGLFPAHTEITRPHPGQPIPAVVVEELTRLKALYQGFGYYELARIRQYTCNERIDDKCNGLRTVQRGLANKHVCGPTLCANTGIRGPALRANGPTLICEGLANMPMG
jgi:hypothetical protein